MFAFVVYPQVAQAADAGAASAATLFIQLFMYLFIYIYTTAAQGELFQPERQGLDIHVFAFVVFTHRLHRLQMPAPLPPQINLNSQYSRSLFAETTKQSPNTGARANNTLCARVCLRCFRTGRTGSRCWRRVRRNLMYSCIYLYSYIPLLPRVNPGLT